MQSFLFQMRRAAAGMLLLLSFSAATVAQDLKSKLPTDPDVVTGKLENGLTYYIRNNHKPANKVELRLVVNAGSILENNDQQGLAHFMEHMNFNGTKNFQKNDLVSYLQSIGVQFGADLNAYTSFDQTVYILPIPTDKPGNLEKGFQIIEDWAHNALLTDKDIDEERGVVLEESRLGKGANDRMLKKYFPKLAEGSLYAERLPIGKDDILKTFKYETIRSFYRDWYRPDLQAVIVVGDIEVATAKKMITDHFGGIKNPAKERPRTYVDVAPRAAAEAMIVTDKEATSSLLILTFPYTKSHDQVTLADYKNNLAKQLGLQMLNHRLNDLAQSGTPPFPYAAADFNDMVHGYEALNVFALFTKEGPEKALKAITGEFIKAKKFGFTESELEIVKKEMMNGAETMFNERKTTDSKNYVEEYIRAFLDNEPFPGISNEYNYYKEMLPAISVKDINAMVSNWMQSENTFTLITAPDSKEMKLPTEKELLAMTKAGFAQEITKTEEKKIASELLTKKPTPGKVTSTNKEEGFDATTYTLSNGIKVTIKPTDFKSDEIIMNGVKKGGSNNYGVADRSNILFVTDLIEAMGVGDFSPTDMEKVLAGKTVGVTARVGEVDDDIDASSSVKDFETMLQLTYLYMTQPRKDVDLFKAYKEKQISMLQFISSNPRAAFADTMVKVMYNNNPLAPKVFPKPADFDQINLDRALQIYKDEFCNAAGYHFFISGNVDPASAIPLLETYLGSIPVGSKPSTWSDNGLRPVKGSKTLNIKKGKEKQSMIVTVYSGEIQYKEDLILKAMAVAEVLNIKVIEELREKMGAIYGGGFRANVQKEPYAHYSIQLQLPCGPENVEKLLTAANTEVKKLIDSGPDTKDLDKVKSQWREKHITDVKENKYWNIRMERVLYWGRDKDRVLNYDNYVEKLTPADIQATAKELLSGPNKFVAILNPES
jgi:zinc protease